VVNNWLAPAYVLTPKHLIKRNFLQLAVLFFGRRADLDVRPAQQQLRRSYAGEVVSAIGMST
jgi:hypothetical protein